MLNLNRIEVIGNLTRDPEVRQTGGAQSVTSFAVATNRRYKDASGNWVDSAPEYHDISVWGPLGERCAQVLHKGDRIFVSGRLQTRSWEAPDGQKKSKAEIVADSILGPDLVNKSTGGGVSMNNSSQSSDGFSAEPAPKSSSKAKPAASDEINIDDIPF
jgi:single-strand DNA-binding protein